MIMFGPRRARVALFSLLASIALLATPARAADGVVVKQALSVKQAWSRATPKGAQVAGGYLTIENHGASADKLISAATPVAAKIEIHEMTTLDGIMMMRAIEGGLVIPPGKSVTLAPGGSHLMFIGLAAPFSEGQHIDAALMFEKAGKIDVSFDVGGVGAKGPRLIVASTEPALPAPDPAAAAAEDFFTHICGTRVMANVVVSPIRGGEVTVSVDLENAEELPLAAQALAITLSNEDAPGAPVTAQATRIASDKWRVSLPANAAGKWSLALGIDIAANDRVDIAAPVLIAK
jgi:periplasmic copper chaperone A